MSKNLLSTKIKEKDNKNKLELIKEMSEIAR
jgi:hypothetical protein